MSKNNLYRVIQSVFKKDLWTISNVQSVLERTNKAGEDYYLFELALANKVQFGSYTLDSHHISVYENYEEGHTAKSQYHYTAYFKDNVGMEYRLHIYFDDEDELLSKPIFSIKNSEEDYEKILCEFDSEFKDLAKIYMDEWVGYVRDLQEHIVDNLDKEYKALNLNSADLSDNIEKNKKAYLEALKKQIAKLNELGLYSNDTRNLFTTRKFLSNLAKLLEDSLIQSEQTENTLEEKEPFKQNEVVSNTTDEMQTLSKPEPAPKKIIFQNVLRNLTLSFKALEKKSDVELIEPISKLFTKIQDVELDFESSRYLVSREELQELHHLGVAIQEFGVGVLQRCLLSGKYEQAKQLSTFHPYLPKDIMRLVLHRNDGLLLDFLLKNQIINVSYKKLRVGEYKYKSLVEYCFKNTTSKSSKADILDVLIKYDTSSLLAQDSNGLPFAAVLLLEGKKHPLWPLLEKNADKTINNPDFLNRLNQALSVIESQHNYLFETKKQISQLITQNRERIKTLKLQVEVGGNELVKVMDAGLNDAKEIFGEDMIKRVQEDPLVQAHEKMIEAKVKLLLPRLTFQERRQISVQVKLNFNDIRKNLAIAADLDIDISFQTFKEEVLKKQKTALRILDLSQEGMDIRVQLRKSGSRERKKLIRDLNEIGQEIKSLSDDSAAEKLEQLNKILKLLEGFKDIGSFSQLLSSSSFFSQKGELKGSLSKEEEEQDPEIPLLDKPFDAYL